MSQNAAEPAKNPAHEDEEIQRKRLLMQNRQFKSIASLFTRFSREVENGTAEQSEALAKALAKELISLEYWGLKMEAIKVANKRDQEGYQQKKAEQEVAIVQAQQDIERRKVELEEARIVRQHNEEYEKLRQTVMQHPQRAATRLECEQLEADIVALQAESTKLDEAADRRKKQFALLLHCIDDLQAAFVEEEEAATDADLGPQTADGTPPRTESMEIL